MFSILQTLVNNSIGKNNENFSKPITAENGALIEGYMMDYKGVCDYMQWKAGGKDVMREKIHNKMKVTPIMVHVHSLRCSFMANTLCYSTGNCEGVFNVCSGHDRAPQEFLGAVWL